MNKKKEMKLARKAAVVAAAQASSYKTGTGHVFGSAIGCRWPVDISEMADRIAWEGDKTVPNRDRDIVARMLPLGSVTRRDGTSIAPRMR